LAGIKIIRGDVPATYGSDRQAVDQDG
jgi:hypothetical protein